MFWWFPFYFPVIPPSSNRPVTSLAASLGARSDLAAKFGLVTSPVPILGLTTSLT